MKKGYYIGIAVIVVVVILVILILRIDDSKTVVEEGKFNYSEGLILMKNSQNGEFACFGCNGVMCKDPAPIMQTYEESDDIYCDNNYTVVRKINEVSIKNDFGNKIVYNVSELFGTSDLEKDCQKRGGTFNECGSPCKPDAELCVMMCAFTCENIR